LNSEIIFLKTLFTNAKRLFNNQNFTESLTLLQNTSELWIDSPKKVAFLMLTGLNFLKLKKYERAERAFLEALAGSPENINALDLLGQSYYYMGKYEKSEKFFLTARNIDFFNFEYTLKSAKAAMKSGHYRRMFKRLKEGYIPEIITFVDERRLRKILSEFLKLESIDDSFILVKKFRAFCYDKKKRLKSRVEQQR